MAWLVRLSSEPGAGPVGFAVDGGEPAVAYVDKDAELVGDAFLEIAPDHGPEYRRVQVVPGDLVDGEPADAAAVGWGLDEPAAVDDAGEVLMKVDDRVEEVRF